MADYIQFKGSNEGFVLTGGPKTYPVSLREKDSDTNSNMIELSHTALDGYQSTSLIQFDYQ